MVSKNILQFSIEGGRLVGDALVSWDCTGIPTQLGFIDLKCVRHLVTDEKKVVEDVIQLQENDEVVPLKCGIGTYGKKKTKS